MMTNINEAAKAVQALHRQLKPLQVVGEALSDIKNLENYKAEAERLHLEAKKKLADLNQQVGASEKSLADAAEAEKQGKARADEAHKLATTTLTNAKSEAERIVAEAKAEFDRQVKLNEQRLADHTMATEEAMKQLDLKKEFLDGEIDQRKEALAALDQRMAELRAKLS
jgi:prefoldin subunit 5